MHARVLDSKSRPLEFLICTELSPRLGSRGAVCLAGRGYRTRKKTTIAKRVERNRFRTGPGNIIVVVACWVRFQTAYRLLSQV